MSADPDCPFCIENGQVTIIAETDDAYLIQAKRGGVLLIDRYMVIPEEHIADERKLPAEYWLSVPVLIQQIPGMTDSTPYNRSSNRGVTAGQRVLGHFHEWILVRGGVIEPQGSQSYGLGFSGVIERLNQPVPQAPAATVGSRSRSRW